MYYIISYIRVTKKSNVLILKPKSFITLSIFFFFISISCKKSTNEQIGNQIEIDLIANLKASIIDQKLNSSSYDAVVIDTLLNQSKWQNGVKITASNGKELIFVPTINNSVGLEFFYDKSINSIDSINIVKVVSTQKNDIKLTLNAIEAYYEIVLLKRNPNLKFSGKIQAFSISNKYKYSYSFQEDQVINRGIVAPVPKNETTKIKSSEKKSLNIKSFSNCELWGHFTIWSDGRTTLDYTYFVCSCDVNTGINLQSGDTFIKSLCEGGGGDPNLVKDIKNQVKDTCLKKVIEYLQNYSVNNSITNILKNIFSVNNKINLTFIEDPNLKKSDGSDLEARTSSLPFQNSIGELDINIFINPNMFINTSQEFRATIIIHEIMHASFRFNNSFPNGIGDLFEQRLQHAEMLENYSNEMADALVTVFGMSKQNAISLTLFGLGDSKLISENVINSQNFQNIITKWGYNNNPTSNFFWKIPATMYQNSENLGTFCKSGQLNLGTTTY